MNTKSYHFILNINISLNQIIFFNNLIGLLIKKNLYSSSNYEI